MGVTGLWQLVSPVGRPIPLETLENKVLAIDISIWLNQALKGFRDAQGQSQPNAHLLGLFHRVSKLLFYKIKPVFVFDGSVPHLKKQTIELRKRSRQAMIDTVEKTAQKILTNMLAKEVVQASSSGRKSNTPSPTKQSRRNASNKVQPTDDIFWLPPLPESSSFNNEKDNIVSSSSDDEMNINSSFYDSVMERAFQNVNEIDVESDDFNALPPDIKHEILCEMKERKRRQLYQQNDMPEESDDFSKYQINRLLKRRHLTKKLENVAKELNAHAAGKLMSHLEGQEEAEMLKVASEDHVHTILIPKNKSEAKKKIDPGSIIITSENMLKETNSKEDDGIYFWEELIDDSVYEDNDVDICMPHDINGQSKITVKNDSTHTKKINEITSKNYTTNAEKVNELAKNDLTQTSDTVAICLVDNNVKQIEPQNDNSTFIDYIEEIDSPPIISYPVAKSTICSSDENEFFIEESSNSDIEYLSSPTKKTSVVCDTNKNKADHPLAHQNEKGVIEGSASNKELNVSIILNAPVFKAADELFPIEIFQTSKAPSTTEDELFPIELFKTASKESSSSKCFEIENITEDICNNEMPENIQQEKTEETEHPKSCGSFANEENPKGIPEPNNQITKDILGKLPFQKKNQITPIDHEFSSVNGPDSPVRTLLTLSEEKRDDLSDALDLERLEYIREQNKIERQSKTVSDQVYQESQDLLKLFGIPFVVSPTEAEAQCAELELLGLTHGTITDDSDIWLFGGSKVYKNFFTQGKYLECYTNKDIENQFGLDRALLVCFALLTGSDYTQGIEGVGPVRAMEIISEFRKDGFETLITFKQWWDESKKTAKAPGNNVRSKLLKLELPDNFPQHQVYQAYLKPQVDGSTEKFAWGIPNLDKLRELAKEKFGWTQTKVDEMLLPVIKKVNERECQTRIDSFFNITLRKEKNLFPSKRIQKALTKIKPGSQTANDGNINQTKSLTGKSNLKRRKADSKNKPSTSRSVKTINIEVNLSEDSSGSSDDFTPSTGSKNVNNCGVKPNNKEGTTKRINRKRK